MAHSVTIASGKHAVALPDGFAYDAGKTVILTDDQYALLRQDLIPTYIIDNGQTSDASDAVSVQGANVAQQGALTSSAPAALTSAAPAALTSTQNATTAASDPTTTQALANALQASYNALQADVAALRTAEAAVQVDVAANRTNQAAVRTDLAAVHDKLNTLIADLTGTGKAVHV